MLQGFTLPKYVFCVNVISYRIDGIEYIFTHIHLMSLSRLMISKQSYFIIIA